MTALFLPLALLFLPEPVTALLQRRRPHTLEQVNRSLRALGHGEIAVLPPVDPVTRKPSLGELFTHGTGVTTVLLTPAYFSQLLTFYFILKWSPKIVADLGFAPSATGGVLVWANVGGLLGSLPYSALAVRGGRPPFAGAPDSVVP